MVRLVPKSDILTESLSHIRILWERREGGEEGGKREGRRGEREGRGKDEGEGGERGREKVYNYRMLAYSGYEFPFRNHKHADEITSCPYHTW